MAVPKEGGGWALGQLVPCECALQWSSGLCSVLWRVEQGATKACSFSSDEIYKKCVDRWKIKSMDAGFNDNPTKNVSVFVECCWLVSVEMLEALVAPHSWISCSSTGTAPAAAPTCPSSSAPCVASTSRGTRAVHRCCARAASTPSAGTVCRVWMWVYPWYPTLTCDAWCWS